MARRTDRRSAPRSATAPARRPNRLRALVPQMAAPGAVLVLFLLVAIANVEIQVGINTEGVPLAERIRSPSLWALALCGLVTSVALPLLPVALGAVLVGAAIGVILSVGYVEVPHPSISIAYSLLGLLLIYVLHLVQRSVLDSSQKQKVINAIGQYIPGPLALRLALDPGATGLRAESRELSVMFCDVRGFTGIAERLNPSDLSELMNALFTPITRIVHQHGGTIDKYIGDSVMAFWGAPDDDPRHAMHAVLAALEIQRAAGALRDRFRERGWPALHLGIGINTGIASVGNMGSEFRVSYTAIGDTVNLAARLQELCSVYQNGVIVGAGTRSAFPSIHYRELGLLEIKGKTALARAYEPIDPQHAPDDTVLVSMRRHNQALAFYYARRWDEAQAHFEALARKHPDDRLYRYYLTRIADYRDHPPPRDWQGEIRYRVQ